MLSEIGQRSLDAAFTSSEVGDSIPPIVPLLQSVDPTFRPVPHKSVSQMVTAFQNASRYRVELLTSNRGSDDYLDQPAPMPAFGGASADPMRFLDFLLRDPVRSILLHKSGKDIRQAELLIEALGKTRRKGDLALAWSEAYERGDHWKTAIDAGVLMMSPTGIRTAWNILKDGYEEIGDKKDEAALETLELGLQRRPLND